MRESKKYKEPMLATKFQTELRKFHFKELSTQLVIKYLD